MTSNSRQTRDDRHGDLRVADRSIDRQLVENRSFTTCTIVLGYWVEPSALLFLLLFVLLKYFFCFLEQRFRLRSSLRYFPSSGKLFPDSRSLVSVLENLSVSLFLSLSLSLVAVVFVALLLFGMEFAPIYFFPW